MGPSYRSSYQIKQLPPESNDLEVRVLSPKSAHGSPGISHTLSSRRRRPQSRRAFKWIFAGILALCLLVFFIRVSSRMKMAHSGHIDHDPIDVVAVSLKPSCVTREAVASLNRYLQPRAIHIVTTSIDKCRVFDAFASNVVCHLQDDFVEGLTVDRVGDFMQQNLGVDQHKQVKGRDLAGWYMQQFIKLGSILALPGLSEYYVIWDLDMVLLSPVQLLWRNGDRAHGSDDGSATSAAAMSAGQSQIQTLVNIGGSIAPGYIASFQRLTKRSLEFAPDGTSFVTHWMVVYKPYLREFLKDLSGGGKGHLDWVWRILGAVDPRSADLGFSEYASYISWVRQHYPQSQILAPRKTWVRHPFGQTAVRLMRLIRADQCCCPSRLMLQLLRTAGYVYTGYEVGHISECRYDAPEHAKSYGL
ncbi:hypothetical protein Vretimale_16944 [Volvox reticuliferus]|uniref:Uncharacterized protein n=1 Tax=Volvox reticuliferus TaxID=1737510 RepID=A0A8J4LXA2_9CHLO|nr:hypothetical protein Vretifemale_16779 [Volvox reticuliferus]GIM13875.1 hypothetical protein Vretimale_16944 [Volvox reticuliferus]